MIGLTAFAALGACSAPSEQYPSLSPRPAEAIDPRVPVDNPVRSGPVDRALAARLAALVDQAEAGDAAFRDMASRAESLVSAAGAPHSEGWIAAQQAISAAQAARGPTARALGDIDELGAVALATKGGISAADKAAIQAAAAQVAAIDQSQVQTVRSLEARLGS